MFVILNRKRIVFMCSTVFLSVFIYLFLGTGLNTNMQDSNVVPTVALPVDRKAIILDSGHGKPDRGGGCR